MYSKTIDIALLLLRLTFGGLMLVDHGWGKLMKFFGDEPLFVIKLKLIEIPIYSLTNEPIRFPDPFGLGAEFSLVLAVFAEVICAILIMIGLFTRQAVIPLIITMLVAIFIMHWEDPFSEKESAITFLVPYVCLFLTGAGFYSLDSKRLGS